MEAFLVHVRTYRGDTGYRPVFDDVVMADSRKGAARKVRKILRSNSIALDDSIVWTYTRSEDYWMTPRMGPDGFYWRYAEVSQDDDASIKKQKRLICMSDRYQ